MHFVAAHFVASERSERFRDGGRTADKVARGETPSVTSSAAHSSPSFLPRSALLTVINAANTRVRYPPANAALRLFINLCVSARARLPLPSLALPIGREID